MRRASLFLQLQQHAFPVLVVLIVLTSAAGHSVLTARTTAPAPEPVIAEIGVEHTLPLEFSLELTSLRGAGILDITQHSAEEDIFVSIPSAWSRRQVRNVPLRDVTAEPPSFGFTRWRLPVGASVSFAVPASPTVLLLHNPSSIALKVNVTRIDLETETVERNVLLVRDAPVLLWE